MGTKSSRLESFRSFASHAWLRKPFAKLKAADRKLAEDFISSHDHLSKGDFELAVNRMFLDREKPRNFTLILEMLSCANSREEK